MLYWLYFCFVRLLSGIVKCGIVMESHWIILGGGGGGGGGYNLNLN